MICKFCQQKMEVKQYPSALYGKEIIRCVNHKPLKVVFKIDSRYGAKWIISNNNYRIVSYGENDNIKTFVQKINHGAKEPKDYLLLVESFDSDLQIFPEEFNSKLKTILTFL